MPRTEENTASAETLGRIHKIEIRTSRLVNELFGGRYLSTFKGRGMEFSDIREYIPGDDIRNIHWKVTARLGQPYVKRFTEERELTILLAVDVSRSHAFGTRGRLKSELAAELTAILSFASLKNNDKVGLLLFSDEIESYIPPRKSKSHVLRIIRDVLNQKPHDSKTNIDAALQYLNRVQKKRAIVFLISDFIDSNFEKSLAITQRHHDTIAFSIQDPMEQEWPAVGKILLEDAETGEKAVSLRGTTGTRNMFRRMAEIRKQTLTTLFARNNIDHVAFRTDQDYVRPMITFFQNRARRYRR